MNFKNEIEHETFKEVADYLPVMLWRISSNFDFDWVNREWLKFTGSTLDEQVGFAWLRFVHPEDLERTTERLDHAFESQKPLRVEFRLKNANGGYKWFQDRGVPLFRNGMFAGFVGTCIEIDNRKQLETLVTDLRAQLTASMR